MSRRMYCYQVPVDDRRHAFALTDNPLHVAALNDRIVEFWEWHDDTEPTHLRAFQVFGTGQPLPDDAIWTGTCDRLPSGLVWHLFEVTP
jgi:hypothetical protein